MNPLFKNKINARLVLISIATPALLSISSGLATGAEAPTRPLTAQEDSHIPLNTPSKTSFPDETRTIRLAPQEKKLINFEQDILSVDFPDTSVMKAWTINARTLVLEGVASGGRRLVVFTAEHEGDKVGKARKFEIQVPFNDGTFATPAEQNDQYTLRLLLIADTVPEKYLWTIDEIPSTAFSSLSSLAIQSWIKTLPSDASITWVLPKKNVISGIEADDFEAFKALCKKQGLVASMKTIVQRPSDPVGFNITPRIEIKDNPTTAKKDKAVAETKTDH